MVARLCVLAALAWGVAVAPAEARPGRVALALAGGGAAGVAHVGVIRALEEAGLRPDCVTGASMGAIVGGLYAAGLTPDQLEAAVLETDWKAVLGGGARRPQTHPLRRGGRLDASRQGSPLPIRASRGGGLKLDAALIDAGDLELRLRELALPASGVENFDRLPIPFRAVATDLISGREVVLSDGDLATAIRASMSIPGVFAPVPFAGRVLVDGGVTNNLPIGLARQLCATGPNDIVIAVSLPLAEVQADDLSTLTGAVSRTISLFIEKSSRDQLRLLSDRDWVIRPPVEEIGVLEFERAVDAIEAGRLAAEPIVQRAAMSMAEDWAGGDPRLQAGSRPVSSASRQVIDVAEVKVVNTSFYKDEVIYAYLDLAPPTSITVGELNKRLNRLRALEAFEQVTYQVRPGPGGGDVLTVYASARASGNVEFRMGARLDDNFDGRARYGVGAGIGFTGLNSLGLRVDLDGMIGNYQAARVRVEQPLEPSQEWFLTAEAAYNAYPTAFSKSPSESLAEYRLSHTKVGADLVWTPTDAARFELGGRYRLRRADLLSGSPSVVPGHLERHEAGPRVAFDFDTLDDEFVPMHGLALASELFVDAAPLSEGDFRGEARLEALGAYDMTDLGLNGFSVQAFARAAGDINGEGEVGFHTIGGFQRLSGLKRDELADNVVGVVGARIISDSEFVEQQTGLSAFWGGGVEFGGAYGAFEEISVDGGYAAISAVAGVRSSFGPFYLGAGATEGGARALYLGFGERF